MSDERSPEQVVGELAAGALDWIQGRRVMGAVLLVTVEIDDDHMAGNAFSLPDQPWPYTLGLMEERKMRKQVQLAQEMASDDD
ncbi:MAG: hypothetical protein AAGC46_19660 [Solirubrobacteraceae bacterium]|nr:hypothetical protein [Patulibacter sp.]